MMEFYAIAGCDKERLYDGWDEWVGKILEVGKCESHSRPVIKKIMDTPIPEGCTDKQSKSIASYILYASKSALLFLLDFTDFLLLKLLYKVLYPRGSKRGENKGGLLYLHLPVSCGNWQFAHLVTTDASFLSSPFLVKCGLPI